MMITGAILMRSVSGGLSRANKDVRLYDMVMQHETDPQDILSVELEAFYGQGGTIEDLTERYDKVQAGFKAYSTIAGTLIGLLISTTLIGLSVKRTRAISRGERCVFLNTAPLLPRRATARNARRKINL